MRLSIASLIGLSFVTATAIALQRTVWEGQQKVCEYRDRSTGRKAQCFFELAQLPVGAQCRCPTPRIKVTQSDDRGPTRAETVFVKGRVICVVSNRFRPLPRRRPS